jgi:hypothetical protein
MGENKRNFLASLVLTIGILRGGLSLNGLDLTGRDIRHNRRGAGKYTSWILLFAVGGTLAAVAAIAISEGFVSATLLVLTVGEWELVAVVFYILAIILYLGEGGFSSRMRGVARVVPEPSFKDFGHRWHHGTAGEQYDAAYSDTLSEGSEA